jgi:hypothetical protein
VTAFSESLVEDAALAWLESLGYTVKHGSEIAPGELRSSGITRRVPEINGVLQLKTVRSTQAEILI